MRYVIIRTIPTVSYEDIRDSFRCLQTLHHGAESLKFIFEMNGLYDSIHISMRVKVIKDVQINAVEAFRGMPSGDKYSSGANLGVLKKENDEPPAARSL